jgi:hypothetical protein
MNLSIKQIQEIWLTFLNEVITEDQAIKYSSKYPSSSDILYYIIKTDLFNKTYPDVIEKIKKIETPISRCLIKDNDPYHLSSLIEDEIKRLNNSLMGLQIKLADILYQAKPLEIEINKIKCEINGISSKT